MSTEFKIFFSGDEYYDSCLKAIENSESQILIESYIFEPDSIGIKFLDALAKCVARGAMVKLTVDGIGSMNWATQLQKECSKRNIPFRIYHPIFKSFRSLNRRNHRKVIIIDQKKVFLGSFNISQVHSEKYSGTKCWRDTGISISFTNFSNETRTLIKSFHAVWENHKLFFNHISGSIFCLNSNPFLRHQMFRKLNLKIKKSKKRIYITNPYFIPRPSILRNLKKASKRGAEVILLLPAISDVWVVRKASRSLYLRLLKAGVRIFEYQSRVLHAKTIVIDDWSSIGSSNLNHRSLVHDLEVESHIKDETCIHQLLNQWEIDIQSSQEVLLSEFENQSFYERIMGRICYWFRYWL